MKRILLIIIFLINGTAVAAAEEGYSVNIQKKVEIMRDLVERGIGLFKKKTVEESCQTFLNDPAWRAGEIGIFIFDSDGVCYLFGLDRSPIWKNYYDKKTASDNDFIPEMLDIGKQGGIVNYRWNHSNMQSYVRTVLKDGKTYIIGAGFYPVSAAFATQQLIRNAIRYGETNSARALFEQINNPRGMFIEGDIYLYVYDFEGNVVAHGESPELVGQNLMDQTTSDGVYRTREMVAIAKSTAGKGWYSYKSPQGDLVKRVFIERFTDVKSGKNYLVAGGYYPAIDDNVVVGLVKRASNYLRTQGAQQAFPEFSKRLGEFAAGSISIFVYDTKGVVRADMQNPAFVGLNLINSRDMEGKYITKLILQHADRYPQGGWLGFSLNNAYAMMYVEKVNVPDGDFIIGASYFPTEKYIHVRFMTDRAVLALQNQTKENAFNLFSSGDAEFLRGDVSVFVYDTKGINYVDGQTRDKIWQDQNDLRDDKGKLITDKIIAIATSGGGWFEFTQNNAIRKIYVNQVQKEYGEEKDRVETYIVGSGYYL